MRERLKKNISFFKDETLENFRKRIDNNELSSYYNNKEEDIECIGVCSFIN